MDEVKLIEKAFEMLKFSYVPYSRWHVGAALLAKNGNVYGGCNIENASYSPTNCAERTAFFKAISEGVKDFETIVVVGGHDGIVKDFCPPCGVCRQVMREFCGQDFKIILAKSTKEFKTFTLSELLPESFSLNS